MATSTVTCPDIDIAIYLQEVVIPQIAEGYTHGFHDTDTTWTYEGDK